AHVRRARRRADDRRFGNRRVDHARLAEPFGEAVGDLERAAVGADVFAEDEDALVALHLFPHPLAQGFEERDFGHQHAPRILKSTGMFTKVRTATPWTFPGLKDAWLM